MRKCAYIIIGLVVGSFFIHSGITYAQLTRPPLLTEVQRARAMLEENIKTRAEELSRFVTSREAPFEMVLALYHEDTTALELVRVQKDKRHIITLPPATYAFAVTRDNGVNSEFLVLDQQNLHVLALAYPIFTPAKEKKRYGFKPTYVVYAPSTDYLATEEIVAAGEAYLSRNVDAVYEELRQSKVHSRAFPQKLLADVIDAAVTKSIIAIEHANTLTLLQEEDASYLNSFYTILATNEGASYAYAKSKAQALGLVQFIPSTYRYLIRTRPDLKLDADFETGMRKHTNAVKAQVAYLDYNLTLLPKTIRPQYEANPKLLGAYLAAMYNGGPARVLRAIRTSGKNWAKSSVLRRETATYIKKYELVYDHFAAQGVAQETAMVQGATLSN